MAAASPACGPANTPTITANDAARVYRVGRRVLACGARGRTLTIADEGNGRAFLDAAVDGPYVAGMVTEGFAGPGQIEPYSEVAVHDMRSGRLVAADEVSFGDRFRGFVARPGGLTAWVMRSREPGGGETDTVRVASGGGLDAEQHWITRRRRPLKNLAITGRTVSFTDRGATIEVPLPGVSAPAVSVTPRPVGRRATLTVKLDAPANPFRPLQFIAVAGSPASLVSNAPETCFDTSGPRSAMPVAVVRLTIKPLDRWCGAEVRGAVLAIYGPQDPETCGASPMPCAGALRVASFSVPVR